MDITPSTLELTAENFQYITLDQYSGDTQPQQLREVVSENQFKRKLKELSLSIY